MLMITIKEEAEQILKMLDHTLYGKKEVLEEALRLIDSEFMGLASDANRRFMENRWNW